MRSRRWRRLRIPNGEVGRGAFMELGKILKTLIQQMENGDADWQMPWHGVHNAPINIEHGQRYSGINRLVLWARASQDNFQSCHWGTFAQWRKLRQPVQAKQKGTALIRPILRRNEKGEDVLHGFHTFYVFNGDQVLNRNEKHPDMFGTDVERADPVEQFVQGTGAEIRYGGSRAAYFSATDHIEMPSPESFVPTQHSTPTQNFYSTLLHELLHWTGHAKRENRVRNFETKRENYAFEELVAELGASFLCAEFGLEDVPRKDHAQYLNSWIRSIKDKPANLWRAATLAQRAVNYLIKTEQVEPLSDDSSAGWFNTPPRQVDLVAPLSLHTG